jgi:hypothetical protein
MRHVITLSSNLRMIFLFLVMIALAAVAILLLLFAGTLPGILALAAAGYLDYTMLRFFRRHMKSWVETTDKELKCRMPDGELLAFPWDKVTAAGYCTQERGRPFLFIYKGEGDKLVTIPREYSGFEALYSEIESRTPFEKLSLGAGETIHERLKEMLKIESTGEAQGSD